MARRVLRKEDTVMLAEAVKQLKNDEKSEQSKFIDLIYRSSHTWSLRHIERANECFVDNIHIHIAQTKHEFEGIKPFVGLCVSIHDQFDDFQFEIHEVVCSGTIEKGSACYRCTAHGIWVKDIGDTKAHGKNIDIDAAIFLTIKGGKIEKQTLVINDGADLTFTMAMAKHTREIAEGKH